MELKLDVQGQGGGKFFEVDELGVEGQFSWTPYVYRP